MSSSVEDIESRLLHLDSEMELLQELKKQDQETKESAESTTMADTKQNDKAAAKRDKIMKVTLLSGFLGAGKTTLLKRILRLNNDLKEADRLKMAVIVNDMGEINLDAEEIKRSKVVQEDAELVEMQNGCICCTLRGDLLKTVKSLSEEGSYDYLVIESTGIGEPLPVAQTFVMDVDSMEPKEGDDHEGQHNHSPAEEKKELRVATDEKKALFHYAKLDTLVTVVDALNVYEVLDSMETLADKNNASGMLGNSGAKEDAKSIDVRENYPGGVEMFEKQKQAVVQKAENMPLPILRKQVASRGLETSGSRIKLVQRLVDSIEQELLEQLTSSTIDDRSIAKLWLDQIEFANVIIVSKAKQLLEKNSGDVTQLKEIEKMIKKLNPLAKVIIPSEDYYGDLDVGKTLINTGLFDMEQASASASWARELASDEHNPETLEYGISSVTYTNNEMPFHPVRFEAIMQKLGTYFGALQKTDKNNVSSKDKKNNQEDDESKSDTCGSPAFKGIVRSKGQVWLANSHAFPINFQTSGRHVDLKPSGMPFLVEKQGFFDEQDQVAYDWMQKQGWWTEKWGDRRSRMVFIGVDLPADEIRAALDKAVLTEAEGVELGGPEKWGELKDPFYHGQLKQLNESFHSHMKNKKALQQQHDKLESELVKDSS